MMRLDWFSDRINPVVLRESRQLVRSRFAVGIMMLFLAIMVVVSGLYVVSMNQNAGRSFTHGQELFGILSAVMSLAMILFVPAHTALPLLLQRNTSGMDLLLISTIRPRAIIWGKMAAAFWMTILLLSVSMPFMLFTVLLRGIGLFEVLASMATTVAFVMVATAGFLVLVNLPFSRVMLWLMSVGYIMQLFIFPTVLSSILLLGRRGGVPTEYYITMASLVAISLPILTSLAIALVSPAVSNRALGPRVTITVCWLVSGIVCLILKNDASEAWLVLSMIGASIAMLVSASEPSVPSQRVRRSIPRNPLLRLPAFPFFSGPLSGWTWCLLIGFVTFLACHSTASSIYSINFFTEFVPFMLYFLAYSLMAAFLRRVTFIRRFCPESMTWLLGGFLIALGCILPFIANFIIDPTSGPDLLWELGNPFAVWDDPEEHQVFATLLCLLLVLLNGRWLVGQLRSFRPPQAVQDAEGAE